MIARLLILFILCASAQAGSLTEAIAPAGQLILVVASDANTFKAEIIQLERTDKKWSLHGEKSFAVLGKNGLATGEGVYSGAEFDTGKAKAEGDRRSPTGVFEVGKVYGKAEASEFGGRMPYQKITANLEGVDDPKSRFYNQIVDTSSFPDRVDWKSHEAILRKDRLYQWLLEIRSNPRNTPGRGSLIFLHIWRSVSAGTVGCVAMEEAKLLDLLRWLDPVKQPRIVVISAKNLPALKQVLGVTDAW